MKFVRIMHPTTNPFKGRIGVLVPNTDRYIGDWDFGDWDYSVSLASPHDTFWESEVYGFYEGEFVIVEGNV